MNRKTAALFKDINTREFSGNLVVKEKESFYFLHFASKKHKKRTETYVIISKEEVDKNPYQWWLENKKYFQLWFNIFAQAVLG